MWLSDIPFINGADVASSYPCSKLSIFSLSVFITPSVSCFVCLVKLISPLSPNNALIVIVDNIIIITMVTTNASKVIPFSFFPSDIFSF